MMSKLEQLAKECHQEVKEVKHTYQEHYRILSKMYKSSYAKWHQDKAYQATEIIYYHRNLKRGF